MPRLISNPYRAAKRRLRLDPYRCFELPPLRVEADSMYKATVFAHEKANDALEDAEADFRELPRRTPLADRQTMQKAIKDKKAEKNAAEKQLKEKYDEREAVLWELANRLTKDCDVLGQSCQVHSPAPKIAQKRGRKPGSARLEKAKELRTKYDESTRRWCREGLEATKRAARRRARHASELYPSDDIDVPEAFHNDFAPAGSTNNLNESRYLKDPSSTRDVAVAKVDARARTQTPLPTGSTSRALPQPSGQIKSTSEGQTKPREAQSKDTTFAPQSPAPPARVWPHSQGSAPIMNHKSVKLQVVKQKPGTTQGFIPPKREASLRVSVTEREPQARALVSACNSPLFTTPASIFRRSILPVDHVHARLQAGSSGASISRAPYVVSLKNHQPTARSAFVPKEEDNKSVLSHIIKKRLDRKNAISGARQLA